MYDSEHEATHEASHEATPEPDGTDDLLGDLTEPQRQAATHVDGPLLIIAGAGSGKTRVITRRVAHLIRSGVKPSSILAITFTNKAAGEMKHRIATTTGWRLFDVGRLDQKAPTICTFHSLCLRILRHYASAVGLANNFNVYDSSDQSKLMKDAIKTLQLNTTNFAPATVHGTISTAKNQLVTAQDYARQAGDFYQKTVAKVYLKYEQLKEAAQALDFDDLLLRAVFAMRDHPDVLAELQERFKYILIDEYQDTNRVQYLLAHALAGKYRNICVVGDPDQSIYAWRGADLRNILDFERDYPDVKVVKLEQNYRSSKTILNIASKLIAKNVNRRDKELWTENDQGEKALLLKCQDERDEAHQVMRILKDLHDEEGYDWSKMAVFYRMNSLSRVMEDALRRASIPYQIARGIEFYNRAEIKDALGYMRAIGNPNDEVNLERVTNTPPRGISDATVKTIQAWGVLNGCNLWQAMLRIDEVNGLQDRAKKAVAKFVDQMRNWRRMAGFSQQEAGEVDNMFSAPHATKTLRDLMETVIRDSGLEAMYLKEDKDREAQVANLDELLSSCAEYSTNNPDGGLIEYLSQVALVSDADHMAGTGGAVTMMTLHAAKGLEFPVVAMIGMEEGILPHARSQNSHDELEEERRLCFVGITRAQERLILSKAERRMIRGITERTIPSKFLTEIPKDSIDVADRTGFGEDDDEGSFDDVENEAPNSGTSFRSGQIIRHPTFGTGRIVEVSPSGGQTRAVIDFGKMGRKTIYLDYAKIEVVG
jgi:DNA helicase II / ATP-dependent DNA helicase PcrA